MKCALSVHWKSFSVYPLSKNFQISVNAYARSHSLMILISFCCVRPVFILLHSQWLASGKSFDLFIFFFLNFWSGSQKVVPSGGCRVFEWPHLHCFLVSVGHSWFRRSVPCRAWWITSARLWLENTTRGNGAPSQSQPHGAPFDSPLHGMTSEFFIPGFLKRFLSHDPCVCCFLPSPFEYYCFIACVAFNFEWNNVEFSSSGFHDPSDMRCNCRTTMPLTIWIPHLSKIEMLSPVVVL